MNCLITAHAVSSFYGRGIPKALSRKTAISPRVAKAPGQYLSGLTEQPDVIPSLYNCSIKGVKGSAGERSVNMPLGEGAGAKLPSARSMKTAICPRVTGSVGQYINGLVEQPAVILSLYNSSM